MPTFTGTSGVDTLTGGSGDDLILGLAANDTLSGGTGGNDTLDGGTGADSMTGGSGNDTYTVDDLGDMVTELSGGGTDTVIGTVSDPAVTLALALNVENLVLAAGVIGGAGNNGDNTLTGDSGFNRLYGNGATTCCSATAAAEISTAEMATTS